MLIILSLLFTSKAHSMSYSFTKKLINRTMMITWWDKTIVSVSNEKYLMLITCFLGNRWWNIGKRTFSNPFLKHQQGEKTRNWWRLRYLGPELPPRIQHLATNLEKMEISFFQFSIKGSCDFKSGSPSSKVTTLLSLVLIDLLHIEIICS